MKTWLCKSLRTFLLMAVIPVFAFTAQSGGGGQDTGGGNAGSGTKAGGGGYFKKSKKSASAAASDSDISAAKASGKVWVNTETRVYHKNDAWYGKTKNGKFMTESDAKTAGYKAAMPGKEAKAGDKETKKKD